MNMAAILLCRYGRNLPIREYQVSDSVPIFAYTDLNFLLRHQSLTLRGDQTKLRQCIICMIMICQFAHCAAIIPFRDFARTRADRKFMGNHDFGD